MGSLSALDFAIIATYFLILLAIGYFCSKKQKSDDYLIAQRKLGTWQTMATMNASKSGSIFMSFVAMTYLWGFSAVWYFIGAVFGIILFIPFGLKLKEYSKKKFYTLADYFRFRYGKYPAFFASILSIFLMFGLAVLNVIAGAKIFVFFTGWPFWICASIMTLVILIYLLLGGFKAVAKTDILQYAAMITILLLLAIIMFKGSFIPVSDWNFFQADITIVIGFFVVGILFPFASPDLWQRVYSSRGKSQLKNGMLLSVGFYGLMAFLLALLALTVKSQFPGVDPDFALITGFGTLLPSGLVGLATVLLFAAIMSNLDTYIFTGSSAIVQDFSKLKKEKIVRNIKKTIVVFSIAITLVALLVQSLIIGSYMFAAFYSVLAIPVLATWIKKSVKKGTVALSFLLGIAATVIYLAVLLSKGEITASLLFVSVGASFLGLIIGGIASLIGKKSE